MRVETFDLERTTKLTRHLQIPRLIEAKKMIEGEFEREKYNRIAKAVTDAGGKVYNGATLQKKIKELVKSGVCDS